MEGKIKLADRIAHDIASSVSVFINFLRDIYSCTDSVVRLEELRETLRVLAKQARDEKEIETAAPQLATEMLKSLDSISQAIENAKSHEPDLIERKVSAKYCVDKVRFMLERLCTLKDGISSGAFASIGYIIGTAAAEVRASGVHKNILIRYSGSGLIANVDETALNRVMTNLLVNASQSMDAGVIHVNLRTHDGMFRIEVIDNGKGIKDKHIGKLFRHGFTRDKKGGTGVGLAYCKDVIENYGGRISVHSKSDTGSIFAINLPKEKSMPTFIDDDSLDF
ncbi:MAG: hypothetical protein A3I09_00180 [Deltaproteobacteria bacterium RIFCSPLOWO2_02_FULL_47_10]|nr:MAG: hypothetical protein A3I09_00180 [Deltaproteobacteria bacterium RIFCSPLOWO2_02_FULL_47_10]